MRCSLSITQALHDRGSELLLTQAGTPITATGCLENGILELHCQWQWHWQVGLQASWLKVLKALDYCSGYRGELCSV